MGIRRKTKLRISYDCFFYCGFGEIWLCFQNSSDCFNPGKHKLIHLSLETTCFFRFDFPHISHTYTHFDAFEIENKRIKLSFSLSAFNNSITSSTRCSFAYFNLHAVLQNRLPYHGAYYFAQPKSYTCNIHSTNKNTTVVCNMFYFCICHHSMRKMPIILPIWLSEYAKFQRYTDI